MPFPFLGFIGKGIGFITSTTSSVASSVAIGAKTAYSFATPYVKSALGTISSQAGTITTIVASNKINSDKNMEMVETYKEMHEMNIEYKKETLNTMISFLNNRTNFFIDTAKEFGENTNQKFFKMSDNIHEINKIVVEEIKIIAPNSYLDSATVSLLICSIPIISQIFTLTYFKDNILLLLCLLSVIIIADYLILYCFIKLHKKKYDGCKSSLDTAQHNILKLQQSLVDGVSNVHNVVQDSIQNSNKLLNNSIQHLSSHCENSSNLNNINNAIENTNNSRTPLIEEEID